MISLFTEDTQLTLHSLHSQLDLKLNLLNLSQAFYNFIRPEYSFYYEELLEKYHYHNKIRHSHDFLSNLIDTLSVKYQIIEENKTEIILHVTNAALNEGFEKKSVFILYDRNRRSLINAARNFPNFYQDAAEGI